MRRRRSGWLELLLCGGGVGSFNFSAAVMRRAFGPPSIPVEGIPLLIAPWPVFVKI